MSLELFVTGYSIFEWLLLEFRNKMAESDVPNLDQFRAILSNLSSQNQQIGQEARAAIDYLQATKLRDLILLCAMEIETYFSNENIVFFALIVLNRALKPNPAIPRTIVLNSWMSQEFEQARNLTKSSLINCIRSGTEMVQNQAALTITYVLSIELELWSDLLSYLVNRLISNESSINEKLGILSTFIEIFSSRLIFYSSIKPEFLPECFKTLTYFLLSSISITNLSNQICLKCTACLYEEITCIPQFFENVNIILEILNALEKRLPIADNVLYRKFHHIILFLLMSYKDLALQYENQFAQKVFYLIGNGLFSNYRSISIDCLGCIYKREKLTGHFDFSHKASHLFTQSLLLNLSEIYEPDEESYNPPDLNNWNYYSSLTLKRFHKVDGIVDHDNQFVLNNTIRFIQDFTVKENSMHTSLSSLYALDSLCIGKKHHSKLLDETITQYFPYIMIKSKSNYQRVAVQALVVLDKVVKYHSLLFKSLDYSNPIFELITYLIENGDEVVNEYAGYVIRDCALRFDPDTIFELFPQFRNIFNKMISNEDYMKSCNHSIPYMILSDLYQNIHDFTYSKEGKENKEELMKVSAYQLLELTIVKLRESFGLLYDDLIELRASILYLMANVLYYLKNKASSLMENILRLLVDIIYNCNDLTEEALFVMSAVFYNCKENLIAYQQPLLSCMEYAIKIPNPRIIGQTALTLGDFFKNIGSNALSFMEKPTVKLYELMLDPNVDNRKDYYSNVISGIASIISGAGKQFPQNERDIYFQKLKELSQITFDIRNNIEVEEMQKLYSSLAYGYQVLIIRFRDDEEFMNGFIINKGRRKNNCVLIFLQNVYVRKAFSSSNIKVYLKLLDTFIPVFGKRFNAQIQNYNIKQLVIEGQHTQAQETRDLASSLSQIIEEL